MDSPVEDGLKFTGIRSFQAANEMEMDKDSEPVKNVYCRNFPDEYDQEKFTEVFSEYGKIVRVKMATDHNYVIIEYENNDACQRAIASLHNVPPLNLYVQLGRRNRVEYHRTNGRYFQGNSGHNHREMDSEIEIMYLDRFDNILDVLVDENEEIYVPISQMEGIKCVLQRLPQPGEESVHVDGENYTLLRGNGRQNAQEITFAYNQRVAKGRDRPEKDVENENDNSLAPFDLRMKLNANLNRNRQNNMPNRNSDFRKPGGPRKVLNNFDLNFKVERRFDDQNSRNQTPPNRTGGGIMFKNRPHANQSNYQNNRANNRKDYANQSQNRFPVGPQKVANNDDDDWCAAPSAAKGLTVAQRLQRMQKVEAPAAVLPKDVFTEDKDEVTVHVEHGVYSNAPTPKPAESLTSPFHKIRKALFHKPAVGSDGVFEARKKVSEDSCVVTVLPSDMAQDLLDLEILTSAVENDEPDIQLEVGAIGVAHHSETGWCRCIVLERRPEGKHRVAFLDWGIEEVVSHVKALAPKYRDTPQFSCMCRVDPQHLDTVFKTAENFKILATYEEAQSIELLDSNNKKVCNATLSFWCPEKAAVATKAPKVARTLEPEQPELHSGERVQLVNEQDGFLFVRTRACHDLIKNIDQQMNESMLKGPMLTRTPAVKQLVAAEFDGSWYRAQVLSVQGDSVDVLYIDYGNEENVSMKSLRHLKDDMSALPPTRIKIPLRGFINKKFSLKALEYLGLLAEKKTVLLTKFEKMEAGVDLLFKDGRSVCEELLSLESGETPVRPPSSNSSLDKVSVLRKPKSAPAADQTGESALPSALARTNVIEEWSVSFLSKPMLYSQLLVRKLPLHEKVRVRILNTSYLTQSQFVFCEDNPVNIELVFTVLAAQMDSYGKRNPLAREPYQPINEELVLVHTNDKWCRATVFDMSHKSSMTVFLVDSGLVVDVKATDVHRLPKEFAEVVSIVELGEYKPVPSFTPQMISRIEELIPKGSKCEAVVVGITDQIYQIDLPGVTAALKAEKIIE